jgi:hypothetical protein
MYCNKNFTLGFAPSEMLVEHKQIRQHGSNVDAVYTDGISWNFSCKLPDEELILVYMT